jgi:hypothetical protein
VDINTNYFLDTVMWTSDEEWLARLDGSEIKRQSAVKLAVGFANVMNHWYGLSSILRRDLLPIGLAVDEASMRGVRIFESLVKGLEGRRFGLDDERITMRYFQIAGGYIGASRGRTPAWTDALNKVFESLYKVFADLTYRHPKLDPNQHLRTAFQTGVQMSISAPGPRAPRPWDE